MSIRAMDLFKAYDEGHLKELDGGIVVSSFFSNQSTYSRYEIVSYAGVKSIYMTEGGLTFQSEGNKLFVLVEPATYPKKHIEPYNRKTDENIPHRYAELEIFVCKDQSRVMVSKEPIMSYNSFTILKPTTMNFSILFMKMENATETIAEFFEKTLNKEADIPQHDARRAAKVIANSVSKFTI